MAIGLSACQSLSKTLVTNQDSPKHQPLITPTSVPLLPPPLVQPEVSPKNLAQHLRSSNNSGRGAVDLLERIRQGYGMDLSSNHADIRKQREFYLKHQDYLNKVLERAKPYLFYIVEQLDQRNMPLELAYLPIVESAYNPEAYSSSGAAGLWQFIPSTGKLYGLKQTEWYDGRRDVIASSEAALDYLQKLYARFDDWHLALAAYNGGEGTVSRAIKANQQNRRREDFWSIALSDETTRYVPKMIAIAQILQDPDFYQAKPIQIPNQPYFAAQQLPHQIDLATTSLILDTSYEELKRLNPGFKRGVSDPQGPHRLLVPIDKNALLNQKASELASATHKNTSQSTTAYSSQKLNNKTSSGKKKSVSGPNFVTKTAPQKPSQSDKPAAASTTSLALKSAIQSTRNPTPTAKAKINATHAPVVKTPGGAADKLTTAVAVSDKNNPTPKTNASDKTPSAAKNTIAAKPTKNYLVQLGDSLYGIAKRFNLDVKDLAQWNALSENRPIQPGQSLWLEASR